GKRENRLHVPVIMEVPAAILIVLGFFTRPLAVIFIFYTLGTAVIGHHYWDMTGDAVLPNMINFWKNVSIAEACVNSILAGLA
ncbi:DoxX family protein, partial [Klebsiella pneumoniae]|uniref:DoxX family protein n=1 Tax=Klebsiella pneumoniae TaxID=573 RepID=UPI00210A7BAB